MWAHLLKKITLKVFHDTRNEGCVFPENSRDLASHLTDISENYALLAHGTSSASPSAQAVEPLSSLWASVSAHAGSLLAAVMLSQGRCMIGIAGILFKHSKSIAFTHYNHNVEDDISQTLCEQMAWICAHACPSMYETQMHPSPRIHTVL